MLENKLKLEFLAELTREIPLFTIFLINKSNYYLC